MVGAGSLLGVTERGGLEAVRSLERGRVDAAGVSVVAFACEGAVSAVGDIASVEDVDADGRATGSRTTGTAGVPTAELEPLVASVGRCGVVSTAGDNCAPEATSRSRVSLGAAAGAMESAFDEREPMPPTPIATAPIARVAAIAVPMPIAASRARGIEGV